MTDWDKVLRKIELKKKILHVFTELEKGEKLGKQKIEENVEEIVKENETTQKLKAHLLLNLSR